MTTLNSFCIRLLFFFTFFFIAHISLADPFVIEWKGVNSIEFIIDGTDTYAYELWDGSTKIQYGPVSSSPTTNTINISSYDISKTYTFKIFGDIKHFKANTGFAPHIRKVVSWGSSQWESFEASFKGAIYLTSVDRNPPNMATIPGGVSMKEMFSGCSNLNSPLNDWNVSKVTDMTAMFYGTTSFNQSLSGWDVSAVTSMARMFEIATKFNNGEAAGHSTNPLNWTFSSTPKLKNTHAMFLNCPAFNQSVSSFKVSNVTDMSSMFARSPSTDPLTFNQSLSGWNVSSVENLSSMFLNADAFNNGEVAGQSNKPLNWTTTNSLENISYMFRGSRVFNQSVNSIKTENVTNAMGMFDNARAFNNGGERFSTQFAKFGKNVNMKAMFRWAAAFDQQIGAFGISGITNPDYLNIMLDYCGMSIINYESTLAGWASTGKTGLRLGAYGMRYCRDFAHNILVNNNGWTISDDTRLTSSCGNSEPFITIWKLDIGNEIKIIQSPNTSYTAEVYDASSRSIRSFRGTGVISGLRNGGTYRVLIYGNLNQIQIHSPNLVSVVQWGGSQWDSLANGFQNCTNLQSLPHVYPPDLSKTTNLAGLFSGCVQLDADFSSWATSVRHITIFDGMFRDCKAFNHSLGAWRFHSDAKLRNMLDGCGMDRDTYEATLKGWDTNNPSSFASPKDVGVAGLRYCTKTYRDKLSTKKWNFVGDIEDCTQPFVTTWTGGEDIKINTPYNTITPNSYNYSIIVKRKATGVTVYTATSQDETHTIPASALPDASTEYQVYIFGIFPQFGTSTPAKLKTVDSWGTIEWKSFENAFSGCENLTTVPGAASAEAPKLGSVTNLKGMFEGCKAFNADISGWDVSTIENMSSMFKGAAAFTNGGNDLNWGSKTQAVKNMQNMFSGCTSFNANIDNWDVSAVTNMSSMFSGANKFDQSLASWKLTNGVNLTAMLDGCAMSVDNYDATLIAWDAHITTNFTNPTNLGAAGLKYCAAFKEHESLKGKLGGVTDAGRAPYCKGDPFVTTWTGGEDIKINTPYNTITSNSYEYSIIVKHKATGAIVHTATNENDAYTIPSSAMPGATTDYQVYILGTYPHFQVDAGSAIRLQSVDSWGTIEWKSFENAFSGCTQLTSVPSISPDLSQVTDMSGMFRGCIKFDADISGWNLNNVEDMSKMFDGAAAFTNGGNDLNWGSKTQAVKNMQNMFSGCTSFNANIDNWDVSAVTNMSSMFSGANKFDQSLASWKLTNGVNLTAMLDGCAMSIDNYDATLIAWDGIAGFTTGSDLGAANLKYCAAFKEHESLKGKLGDIIDDERAPSCAGEPFVTTWTGEGNIKIDKTHAAGTYNYSIIVKNSAQEIVYKKIQYSQDNTITLGTGAHKVYIFGTYPQFSTTTPTKLKTVEAWGDIEWKSFENAFKGCTQLTAVPGAQVVAPAPSEAPKLGSVTNLKGMFEGCKAFNADISGWNVSTIDNMSSMFKGASTFDQDLNSWDVTDVTDMTSMFEGATSFSQNLKDWKVNSLRDADHMLDGTKIDVDNYDATLISWYTHIKSLSPKPMVTQIGVDGLKYCNGEHARQELGWTFQGDSKDCSNATTINVEGPFVYGTTYDKALSITKAGTSYIPSGATFTVRAPAELGTVSIDNGTRHLKLIPKEVGDFTLEVDMTALGVTLTYALPITVEKAPQDIDATNFDLTTVDQSTYTMTGVKLKRMENGILTDTEEPQYILKNDDGVIIIEGHTFKITGESGITQIYAKKDGNKYYKPAEEVFIAEITAYEDEQPKAIIDQYALLTKVYPNPLQEGQQKINIELPNAIRAQEIYLYDEIGRHIDVNLYREGGRFYFLTNGLVRGLYIIVIKTDKGIIRKKLSIL